MESNIAFPLYEELHKVKFPELATETTSEEEEITAVLAKIKQLDSSQAEIIYAIIQMFVHETAKNPRSAKAVYNGTWVSANQKRGVKFRVKKLKPELRKLLAAYILYITGDNRLEG